MLSTNSSIVPQPPPQLRLPSPAQIRKTKLLSDIRWPRSFTVEAICAIPHPCATHALTSSLCMTHLITGSDDGYIRDYDLFAAVNGKIFLTAPQRQHCGVIEGIMKAGQIRCWWENAIPSVNADGSVGETPMYPVYSLAMQSDALWSLAGSDVRPNFQAMFVAYMLTSPCSKGTFVYILCDIVLAVFAMSCTVTEHPCQRCPCSTMKKGSSVLVGTVKPS